jgi:hypothetical protein
MTLARFTGTLALSVILVACGGGSDPSGNAPILSAPKTVTQTAPQVIQPASRPNPFAKYTASKGLSQASDGVSQQIVDVYDVQTGVLTIPSVLVGTTYYKDVQITLGSLVSVGTAHGVSGAFDTYRVETNELFVPVVRVGSSLYYNVVVTVGSLINYGGVIDSISVPIQVSEVSYPASFQTPTVNATDINQDPCNLTLNAVTYPASWNGERPLPTIAGAPLKPAIKRGMMLKDIMLHDNPAYILGQSPGAPPAGCTGSLQSEFIRTLNRLQTLGVEYAYIPQWHWASMNNDGSWYIAPAEAAFGPLSDANLAFFVQQAHARGIKVMMMNQIQGMKPDLVSGPAFVPPATTENLQKWFVAYQAFMIERATYFQSLGIDLWEISCSVCMYGDQGTDSEEHRTLFYNQYKTTVANVKSRYSGKTMLSTANGWLYTRPDLASLVDVFMYPIYDLPLSAAAIANLTVENYKQALAQSPLQFMGTWDDYEKSIMVVYGAQSRQNVFTGPGYMEETDCTAAQGDLNISQTACMQRETRPDFAVQAIVHEATLEFLNAMTWKSELIVAPNDYWLTDSLMPFRAFPNLGASIRNKPAEGIVKAWYAR